MKHLECIINSGIFSEINKAEYLYAFEQLKITEREYRKNETIFLEGDLIETICIIERGSVRGEKNYPNGEVHIVSVFEEGNMFGVEITASRTRVAAIDFVSNEDTLVVFVNMRSVDKGKYSSRIRKALSFHMADENVRMTHKIEILAERGLRERIKVYLRILQSKAGADTVTVKMNREQMAQFLCVNRSALSNELNKMKREGLIDFKGSNFKILK